MLSEVPKQMSFTNRNITHVFCFYLQFILQNGNSFIQRERENQLNPNKELKKN